MVLFGVVYLLKKTLLDSTSVMYKRKKLGVIIYLLNVEEKLINFAYISAQNCLSLSVVMSGARHWVLVKGGVCFVFDSWA